MRSRSRRILITLEEDVARCVRLEAESRDTSISGLLSRILRERMGEQEEYERAMRRALARKPFLKTDGSYPSRKEIHERDLRP